MNILIIEDDSAVAGLIADILVEEFAAEITAVTTHVEAIQRLETDKFDLILADGSFAGWGGKLIPEDRESLLRLATSTRLVVVTGASWAVSTDPSEVGALAIIQKPFDIVEFVSVIGGALSANQG